MPTPTPTPAFSGTAAVRLLKRTNALIAEYSNCKTADEKRALLGITNSNFSNDTFRAKLVRDLGGSWERLESGIVGDTQYQQGKSFYVQVYLIPSGSSFIPVIYSTQNSALSGNQWATNLIYNDETRNWMEYTQKHAYNDSRVTFSMTNLSSASAWSTHKDAMASSSVWRQVIGAIADTPTPAPTELLIPSPTPALTPAPLEP